MITADICHQFCEIILAGYLYVSFYLYLHVSLLINVHLALLSSTVVLSSYVSSCAYYLGSGVFCDQSFANGDFLLEYRGELISSEEGAKREQRYERENKGNFLFFFHHEGLEKW